ncbi:TAXI family TRAP transporter solute-binding subunit [Paenarthrobacter ureafaciens]|uniref:TAXI family TRAP transporter solute-binding subunit n=1 Tax=Paenarthrobacter ureafaciens TaxID=37931 RepID=UPI001A9945B6|nr:TAXI family TRAP transporter solute-binding subunit [Paenarthrobacter ureafaciens]MEC3851332.1 TAXI family TRAP transporter solute-binding subunit [Paenarthrobacter ureafaciens]QSZ51605.1 C4-dicarboxylate ABC transporter substrate-binding protein [Paenarthrobacter ureafaciens]
MARPLSRRTVLTSGLILGSAGLLMSSAACTPEPKPEKLTVAGGESGGFYLEFATLLAGLLQREGVAETAEPLVTGGSLENIRRVMSGEATFAVALADTAALPAPGPAAPGPSPAATGATPAAAGATPAAAGATPAGTSLVALGKVYENYVHCIVRADSGIGTFADLAGKVVGVGEAGSGTSLTAPRIIASAVLEPAPQQVNLGLNQGLSALRGGSIDALFWSGGVPTAAIAATASVLGVRLLDLSLHIAALRTEHGDYYDRVLIPAGTYGDAPAIWTVGVANLLLCRSDLPDSLARRTVRLLVERAQDLIPTSSTGVQFLSPETLINTAGVPLHPAAAAAYRSLHG